MANFVKDTAYGAVFFHVRKICAACRAAAARERAYRTAGNPVSKGKEHGFRHPSRQKKIAGINITKVLQNAPQKKNPLFPLFLFFRKMETVHSFRKTSFFCSSGLTKKVSVLIISMLI